MEEAVHLGWGAHMEGVVPWALGVPMEEAVHLGAHTEADPSVLAPAPTAGASEAPLEEAAPTVGAPLEGAGPLEGAALRVVGATLVPGGLVEEAVALAFSEGPYLVLRQPWAVLTSQGKLQAGDVQVINFAGTHGDPSLPKALGNVLCALCDCLHQMYPLLLPCN